MGVWREVPYQAVHKGMRRGLVVGIARKLDLHKRLPELFRRRGWPLDNDVVAGVVIRAVACVALNAQGELIDIPDEMRQADKWRELGERAEATEIVSRLNLGHLLEV